MLNAINADSAVQMQTEGAQAGGSQMEAKAKSMGAPDSVIAQGPGAIKAWAKENGIVPGAAKEQNDSAENKSNVNLMDQLEEKGISYESFSKAMDEGPEAVEDLFGQHNFSFNVMA